MQPRWPASQFGGGGELPDQVDGSRAQVDAVRDRVLMRRIGSGEQAQHRRLHAGLAQRDAFGHLTDTQPGRAACQRGQRRWQHSVPVAVGLDHGHDLSPGGLLRHRGYI